MVFFPKLLVFTELAFGFFIVLIGLDIIYPLLGLRLAIGIGLIVMLPIFLYAGVVMIIAKPQINSILKSKGVYWIIFILLLISFIYSDTLGSFVATSIVVFCGILVILLAAWHFKIIIQEDVTK